MTTQGLSKIIGFNHKRRKCKTSSHQNPHQTEASWHQADLFKIKKTDPPHKLQKGAEHTFICDKALRDIITQLLNDNNIMKQNFEKALHDKIKQDQTIREMENLVLAINEVCHSLVMELYKDANSTKTEKMNK